MLDQQKIGNYLKELRKQKNLTQEQLAEQFGTTSRSVSRWETGSNMPDLSVLVELASFYDVKLNELINGEKDNEDTVTADEFERVVEYADTDKERLRRQMVRNNVIALVLISVSMCLYLTGNSSMFPETVRKLLMGFSLGLSMVVMIRNILVNAGKTGCYRDRH